MEEIDNLINKFHRDWIRFFVVLLIQLITRLLEAFEYFLIIKLKAQKYSLNIIK